MKPSNEVLRGALSRALGALFELDDCGHVVGAVVVRDDRPTLLIDPPEVPPVGAIYSTRIERGERQEVGSAEFAGVRIEWDARSRSARA